MKRIALLALFGVSAVLASAQSRTDFQTIQGLYGVDVNFSQNALWYQLVVWEAPQLAWNGQFYNIRSVLGIYALSNANDLTANMNPETGFLRGVDNAGIGGAAGWKADATPGVLPGNTITFQFNDLNTTDVADRGFWVRLDRNANGTNSDLAYVTLSPDAVPEPGTIAALMGVGLWLGRRRYSRAK